MKRFKRRRREPERAEGSQPLAQDREQPLPTARTEGPRHWGPDHWSSLAQWIGLVVAVVGGWLVYGQLTESVRRNDLATASGQLARETYLNSQRAWVLVDSVDGVIAKDPTRTGIQLRFKNTGQGPAVNIQIVGSDGVGVPPKAVEDDVTVPTGGQTLGPGQDLTSILSISRYADEAKAPYVVGTVRYQDQFGATRRTDFCWYVYRLPETGELTFRACDVGNRAE